MLTSLTLALAAVICTAIYHVSKWYVDHYCQDNPEIIWIWLDDEEIPSGHPVRIKTKLGVRTGRYSLSPAVLPL